MEQQNSTDLLYSDPRLAQFYDLENPWDRDQAFCLHLARESASVLDLGCGTGLLATEIASRLEVSVVAVDPAAAMLEIAASRPGGDAVDWVQQDARFLDLGRRFDLIVMTGHAFQCLLNSDDQAALFATVAQHLTPRGRFIFDSRNPHKEAWRAWTPDRSRRVLNHPVLGQIDAWTDAMRDAESGLVTYVTHYKIAATKEELTAQSLLCFSSQETLARLIAGAGLQVERWLGAWPSAPDDPKAFTPYSRSAPEIIPIGCLTKA
ncbi:MAG: methyltransferase domain-containing protein [Alphaproteobacteria bacterium]|nr:methyltransferase domain-containing protein [Alphaproteobacteria bacterium]